MKIRVHELAKKYDIKNKEFIEILKNEIGIDVSSHLANLHEEQINKVEQYFKKLNKVSPKKDKEQKITKDKTKEKEDEKRRIDEEKRKEEDEKRRIDEENKRKRIDEKAKKLEEEIKKTEDAKKREQEKPKVEEKIVEKIEIEPELPKKDKKTFKGSDKNRGSKRKKGRRTDFTLKTLETAPDIIEEDGMKIIKYRGDITLGNFAEKLGVNSSEIIKKLFVKGKMFTINSPLNLEMAEEIAMDYNVLVEEESEVELEFGEKFNLEIEDRASDLIERPPVITIMGHVDHGKTSLLDAIRTTNVVSGEDGGITQKIGAYQIERDGKKITFVDTPGHEAFTDMRARGVQVTDIAILVVAADDGVMPQTIEAISHAKAANVPIIVAINKIDKPDSNAVRVKQELMEHGLVSAEWGGDVEFVEVSAKQKLNLEELLDTILITAEILELKANPKKRAKAVIIESRLDPKVGAIADILVQEGTLRIGDVIIAGEVQGKVRALISDKGEKIGKVSLSQPAEIIGFHSVPEAGTTMYVIQNEQHAKRIAQEVAKARKISETTRKTISLESLSEQLEHENLKELNLILRADSKGSVEALRDSLIKLSNDEVAVNIIQAASGAITESDVKLAEVSNAIIIGFHVRPTTKALKEADASKVEIRTSGIIYHITEDIEKALSGMLDPEFRENYLGRIEIKKVFKVSKVGNIAGCVVVDGKVRSDSNIRMLRNGVITYEGKLSSLKRYKDDAKEVIVGQECGLGIQNFNDIKEGDIVEAFEIQEIKRTLK